MDRMGVFQGCNHVLKYLPGVNLLFGLIYQHVLGFELIYGKGGSPKVIYDFGGLFGFGLCPCCQPSEHRSPIMVIPITICQSLFALLRDFLAQTGDASLDVFRDGLGIALDGIPLFVLIRELGNFIDQLRDNQSLGMFT